MKGDLPSVVPLNPANMKMIFKFVQNFSPSVNMKMIFNFGNVWAWRGIGGEREVESKTESGGESGPFFLFFRGKMRYNRSHVHF